MGEEKKKRKKKKKNRGATATKEEKTALNSLYRKYRPVSNLRQMCPMNGLRTNKDKQGQRKQNTTVNYAKIASRGTNLTKFCELMCRLHVLTGHIYISIYIYINIGGITVAVSEAVTGSF